MWPLILEAGFKILERVIPDPQAKAAAQMELLKMQQAGELAVMANDLETARLQTEVNKVEAASSSVWVGGWRPGVGWTCAAALFWHYIGAPFAGWVLLLMGNDTPIPAVELGDLIVILAGMLGLGGLRTAEKMKGVAR